MSPRKAAKTTRAKTATSTATATTTLPDPITVAKSPRAIRVFIAPHFANEDTGEGGIRRVVEAQETYLPLYGVEIVQAPADADVLLVHANHWHEPTPDQVVVAQTHGLYWDEYQWDRWAYRVNRECLDVMLKADVVVTPSEWVSQAVRRNTMIPAITVHHGIDTMAWTPFGDDDMVGRDELPLQYILWNKNRPDPICDPTPVNQLAERLLADSSGVTFITTYGQSAPNVAVTGRVPHADMKKLVREAWLYLATSRETFGVGTLEAMSAGVPILGYAWGGQREIVRHRIDGYLARPGDINDLVEGYRFCMENRGGLSYNARERAAEFSWHKAAEKYVQVFRDALDERTTTRVSVVIPTYNMREYLPDAINSVLAQEHAPPTEIVVVDDASTDDTQEYLAQFKDDSRVRVVRHEKNQYLASALNTGVAHARGEYVVPLDADNMLAPRALDWLSAPLMTNRALDITYGKMLVRDGSSSKEFVSDWPPPVAQLSEQMKHRNQISSTAMYRRKIWQRVGGYRRRCRTAEDADFWCRALSFGARGARVSNNVTFIYRDRADSMSHTVADWDWNAWYTWSRQPELTPAAALERETLTVRSFEPIAISVIIPVAWHHRHVVVDALDSLVAQTFQRWEVICVFDWERSKGSPWLPPFAKAVFTGGQKGPAVARNMGARIATGRYFLPLDADDYLSPQALEKLYAKATPETYVYCDWFKQETQKVYQTNEYNCHDLLRRLPHAVTALYPALAWRGVGGFDETLDAWEDWDFVIALAAKGVCGVRLPIPLLYYRTQLGSRREELYARREELAKNIHAKWGRYIDGTEELMACGCGGRSNVAPPAEDVVLAANGVQVEGQPAFFRSHDLGMIAARVEYIGKNSGPITFRGMVTAKRYRFGHDRDHRRQDVARVDLEMFTSRPGEFRIVTEPQEGMLDEPFLVALGPPKRNA